MDPLRSAADGSGSGPGLGRRLKRADTWAAPKDAKLMVPKLPLPGALQKATGTRPQVHGVWWFLVLFGGCFFVSGGFGMMMGFFWAVALFFETCECDEYIPTNSYGLKF